MSEPSKRSISTSIWCVDTAVEEQLEPLARGLARAFRDNPLNQAAIRRSPRGRLRSNLAGMRMSLASAWQRGLILSATQCGSNVLVGGLVALQPLTFPLPPPPLGTQVRGLLTQGFSTARRWGDVYRALEAVHPKEPHWYLAILGVEPDQQGRGCGRALLEKWIQRVDLGSASAYLETDRSVNVGFYQGFGFTVLDELEVLGVPIWRMSRAGSKEPR